MIEAVFEELELKQQLLRQIEELTAPNCIFASNSSSLPISKIASVSGGLTRCWACTFSPRCTRCRYSR